MKPYYLLTKEEVAAEGKRIEALTTLTKEDLARMKGLTRMAIKFKTTLSNLIDNN